MNTTITLNNYSKIFTTADLAAFTESFEQTAKKYFAKYPSETEAKLVMYYNGSMNCADQHKNCPWGLDSEHVSHILPLLHSYKNIPPRKIALKATITK